MSAYQIRRATTDDLAQLVAMWQSLDMPALELEKVFTDFQVAEDGERKLVGAIALEVVGSEGRLHSESIPDFALADLLRPLFWERMQSVARNRGLVKIWTNETALFWKKDVGFADPHEDRLRQLPAAFGKPGPGWFLLQLRSDDAMPQALEKQLEVLMATQDAERAESMRQAQDWARKGQMIKTAATIIAVLIFLVSLVVLFRTLGRS